MIKIVYVFVGNKIEYLNMLRVSIASVRKHMPNVETIILSDEFTGNYLKQNSEISLYNVSVISVEIPDYYNTVEKSRYLKTNLREFVQGDLLYIDSDTIICDNLEDTELDSSVCLVLDEHCILNDQEGHGIPIRTRALDRNIDLRDCVKYYNSGVILAKDDDVAHEFFRHWYNKWESTRQAGKHEDQFSLNAVNQDMNVINELHGTWNCQITATYRAFSYLRNIKILHYLSIQDYGIYRLNDLAFLSQDMSIDDINEIIECPEKMFCSFHCYSDTSVEYTIMQDSPYHFIFRMFTQHKKIYDFIEKVLSKLRK